MPTAKLAREGRRPARLTEGTKGALADHAAHVACSMFGNGEPVRLFVDEKDEKGVLVSTPTEVRMAICGH